MFKHKLLQNVWSKNKGFRKLFLMMLAAISLISLFAFSTIESNTEPIHLFEVGRSLDENYLRYDLNLSSNVLDLEKPISIYWVNPNKGNEESPLSWIQKRYAYGLDYKKISETEVEFQFVSYDKRTFYLKKDNSNEYHVFTMLDDKEIIVTKIFVQIDGGTFWFPKVTYVELHYLIPGSTEDMLEIINP